MGAFAVAAGLTSVLMAGRTEEGRWDDGQYQEHFGTEIDLRPNKFAWMGAATPLDAFTFAFEETEWGWFQLHAYRFDDDTSTVIVETPEANWRAAGLDAMSADETIRFIDASVSRQ